MRNENLQGPALLRELAVRVPALAGPVSEVVDTFPVNLAPLVAALQGLDATDKQIAEQLLTGSVNTAAQELADTVGAEVTDADILTVALAVNPMDLNEVMEIDPSILKAMHVAMAAARTLAGNADDVHALRTLLAAGYADVLLTVDRTALVRDADPWSRQAAVTGAAAELADMLASTAIAFLEAFTQSGGAPITTNLGALNVASNRHVTELLVWYPDVIDHFDGLLAAHVPDSPAGL